ncbi:MAG: phage gp6-like head-tail connector protein [Actinomycetota bacterium]
MDLATNRQFGLTGSAVDRYYAWDGTEVGGRQALEIDDLQTLTGLTVVVDLDNDGVYEETLVNGTDFDLYPFNAAAEGKPYTHLVMRTWTTSGTVFLPTTPLSVKVTANWGWSTVPTVVKQATLLQASRFFARRNSPYGIAGSPELGNEMRLLERLDPDVAIMLRTVKRHWAAA